MAGVSLMVMVSDTILDILSGYATQTGLISGAHEVTKTGAGWLRLEGNNTYSGGTILKNGRLQVAHDNALGTGAVTVQNGSLSYGNGISISNAVTFAGSGNVRVDTGTAYQRGRSVRPRIPGSSSQVTGSLYLRP